MISTTGSRKGFVSKLELVFAAAFFLVGPGARAQTGTVIEPSDQAAKLAPKVAPDGSASLEEHWYQLLIGDAPAGWMVVRQARQGDRLVSDTSTRMEVGRGGQSVRLEMASRFVEHQDGTPIEAWSRQSFGPQPIETTYRFLGETVEVTTLQGERERKREQAAPEGSWMPPARAQIKLAKAIAAGDAEVKIRSLDPLFGLEIVETTWRRLEPDIETEVPAGTFVVQRYEQIMSAAPGLVATVDLDANAALVASTTPFMGMTLRFVLADRETATASAEPPELLVASFIYPDRTIERPRSLRRAVYRLRLDGGGAPEVPSVGAQHTEVDGDATLVRLDLTKPAGLAVKDLDRARFLAASTFLDHRAETIRQLASEAIEAAGLAADAGPTLRAEALRRFVHGHLDEKNLDSLLATAVEVAASRAGDCTEHSVLLAALLRAEKIPSRVVTGLLYVDRFVGASDLFGYHMWTQALVDGRWQDLDATLGMSFDAAHIALATSALGDEQAALIDLATIVPIMGRLRIEVVETAWE